MLGKEELDLLLLAQHIFIKQQEGILKGNLPSIPIVKMDAISHRSLWSNPKSITGFEADPPVGTVLTLN